MAARKTPWSIIFSFMFLCFSLKTHLSIGVSTISAGKSLSGGQTIISEGNGKFELGFFSPGSDSGRYYIGIWDTKNRLHATIVWVANREKPLSDYLSSELKLLENGNLVLLNSSKAPIWSTNLDPTTSNSTEAVLLDTGNFVLRNVSDALNSSAFRWESFDHPTDTWLPGGKLGFNKLTNKLTLLTSWRNKEDPAPGIFSLELDAAGTGQYFILRNMSQNYWTSGTWNGQIFRLVPETRINYIYNFTYVSNEKENYFYYTLYNTSITSRFVMGLSGQIQQLFWYDDDIGWNLFWSQPRQQCEVPDLCGAFGTCTEKALPFCGCLPGFDPRDTRDYLNLNDWSGGCKRRTPLQCMNASSVNGQKDGFLLMPNMKLPKNPHSLASGSAEACSSACLNDCSCTAYAYVSGGCSVWNGDLLNLQQLSDGDTGGGDLHIKLAAADLPRSGDINRHSKQRRRLLFMVVPTTTIIGTLFLGTFICFWRRRMFNQRGFRRAKDILRDNFSENGKKDLDAAFFNFRSIAIATSNFSDSNKLGQGGFGHVYKGKLSTGQEIAVKRLSRSSGQGLEEFENEVILIAKLQHRNLVRLIGYCIQGDEKMLLYEYMPNKSLDYFLFDQNRRSLLDWKRSLTIVLGIARGLLYLHQDSRLRIIHRDLKASNVLLDEEMNPKISDFGLARMFEGNQTQANTNRVVGTYGYMSPEYALDGLFSVKSDVFSFGVLLLEIISEKKNTGFYHSEHSLSLLGYAWRLWREEKGLELMDPLLNEDNNVHDVLKCIHVGLLCARRCQRSTNYGYCCCHAHKRNCKPTNTKTTSFLYKKSLHCGIFFQWARKLFQE